MANVAGALWRTAYQAGVGMDDNASTLYAAGVAGDGGRGRRTRQTSICSVARRALAAGVYGA